MTILLTAGTGKTAQKLVPYLDKAGVSYLLTSRSPKPSSEGPRYVQFDFADPSTYANAFPSDLLEKVKAVWVIMPGDGANAEDLTNDFVDYAVKQHGVQRFVVLTGTTAKKGGPSIGQVWQRLSDLGVEYTVLRATWFTENFTEWFHYKSIKDEGVIYSAVADGKSRYVTTDDIARLAFHALTNPQPLPENVPVLGPELLTLDQAAQIFTEVLGRPVKHRRQDQTERTKFLHERAGLAAPLAGFMAWLEVHTANGGEENDGDEVERYTGIKPKGLRQWIEENKKAFEQ